LDVNASNETIGILRISFRRGEIRAEDRQTVDLPLDATLLRVYLNASDRLRGKALYRIVVERARELYLAGASVFLVDFSYGVHRRFHDAKSDYLSFDIPVVVEMVDSEEKVGLIVTELNSIMAEGLMVTRPVRVVRYAGCSVTEKSSPKRADVQVITNEAHPLERSTIMRIEGEAQRVTVYVGSSDTWHGRNLVAAIVGKCRELGIAGATATVGTMGFGKTSRIHRAHLLGLSEDLPERIEIVDRAEQIATLLPHLDDLVQGGLVVLEDVRVVRYLHDPKSIKS
jgi:PII-like signaling protein